MNTHEAISYIQSQLNVSFDERETKNLSRIILEDGFGLSFPFKDESIDTDRLQMIVKEVLNGTPIQYILGTAHFYGFDLKVNEHVLIPRPETEELLYYTFEYFETTSVPLKILDIGTGSGCIPLVLKSKFPNASITAVDLSSSALGVAKYNIENQGFKGVEFVALDFLNRDLWEGLGDQWDLIISNPPYIPRSEEHLMSESTKKYEPHMALFTEDHAGQEFYLAIAEYARKYLKSDGVVFCELNEYWSKTTIDHFKNETFQSVSCIKDMQGKDRILRALF
jgi:release factor glutamine methyltransferase